MKKYISIIFVLIFQGFSVDAYSTDSVIAKVQRAGMYGSGRVMVKLDTTINEPGCEATRFDIEADHPQIQSFLSIALAAAASKSDVKVLTNGCLGSYPKLDQSNNSLFYFRVQ